MTESDALALLDARARFGMRPGLETIRGMLGALGNPERRFRVVHVGGTNGKGSVSAMIASALRAAGHRTGLYTSPHLVRFHERIQVDGVDIAGGDLARAMARIRPALDAFPEATYFEVATALALQHFADAGVEVAVLEVGLGGRLDATNVIASPLVTVVTNVTLEHTEVLGDTVEAIAREKGGIVKPGVPLVTGATGPALQELRAIADAQKTPVLALGEDFVPQPIGADDAGQALEVHGLRELGEVRVPLLGAHQAENAALALAALDACDAAGVRVPPDAVRAGLAATRWRGRLERRGRVLLDGAHNPAGAVALAQFLKDRGIRPVLVFGALADKDWRAMIEVLAPHARDAIATRPPSPRALDPMEAARAFSQSGIFGMVVEDVGHALRTAEGIAGPDGTVLVTGSLYLVGDALARLS